ncbi:MAG: DUF2865 domain-containing protein [Hyphomicrobiaceae bacterium]
MRRLVLVALCLGAILGLPVGPAAAQGLFDFLFGTSPAKVPSPPSVSRVRPIVLPGAMEYRPAPQLRQPERAASRASGGARFRTLCVRLCDGYYWPVSQSATRAQFYRDAEACHSQCDNEARLFYAPVPGDDVSAAVDQRGLAYTSLDTAFLYRKARVPGCVCRPVPWSAREVNRHRAYALDAAAERRADEAARLAIAGQDAPGAASVAPEETSHGSDRPSVVEMTLSVSPAGITGIGGQSLPPLMRDAMGGPPATAAAPPVVAPPEASMLSPLQLPAGAMTPSSAGMAPRPALSGADSTGAAVGGAGRHHIRPDATAGLVWPDEAQQPSSATGTHVAPRVVNPG